MDFVDSDKISVLLNIHSNEWDEIRRRQDSQQQIFEWSTGFLVAIFGVVIALSNQTDPIPHPILIKIIATILISIPTILLSDRLSRHSGSAMQSAQAVERIEKLLKLYEDGFYGSHSPYPQEWAGKLAQSILKSTTPVYQIRILCLMAICVAVSFWALL